MSDAKLDVVDEEKKGEEKTELSAQLDAWCRVIPAGYITRHLGIAGHHESAGEDAKLLATYWRRGTVDSAKLCEEFPSDRC